MALWPSWVSEQARLFAAEGFRPYEISAWFLKNHDLKIPHSTMVHMCKRRDRLADTVDKMGVSTIVDKSIPAIKEIQPVAHGTDIAVIGDIQVKPNIPVDYCRWVGQKIADDMPAVIVNIGDFADMPSCSMWDQPGSKSFAAQNYKEDILAVHRGMKALMEPIQVKMKASGWSPRLVMLLGNHEDRITRTLNNIPKLDGTIGLPDLEYERWGWEVHPFLQQVEIEGIVFSHYFPSGQMGRPISSARAMLSKLHMSCIAGHQQGRDIAFGKRANGKQITAIICGSTYIHDEEYLNPQTNNHWRGFYMLNDCREGEFEEKAISMRYLQRKYGV